MRHLLTLTFAASALVFSSPAAAGERAKEPIRPGQAVPSQDQGNGTPRWARDIDPDQGDDNASDRAIDEVCTKDTPAADRSAICDSSPISRG